MLVKIRFRFPEIFFGMLLAVAIFAMGMVFSSRHQPSNAESGSKSDKIEASHKPNPFSWDWLTHDGVAFFTAALTLVAGIQAGLFIWQLRYMRRGMKDATIAANAARESADAATSAERPHLLVSNLSARVALELANSIDDKTVPMNYAFEVRNYGRSPAFMGDYIFQFHSGELPATPHYDKLWRDSRNIIVPDHPFRSVQEFKIADIPVVEVERIKKNELPFYIFGIVEYKSIFRGKTHKLRFCYRMIFDEKSFASVLFQPDGPDSYWEYA